MRGGKRQGAGRKGYGPSKTYRLPIALEPQIIAMMEKYKAEQPLASSLEKPEFETVTESKEPVITKSQYINAYQIERLQKWLLKRGYAKSRNQAKQMTETRTACNETFRKCGISILRFAFKEIEDIVDLYLAE
jgi:predicted transcriptional regulator